MTKSTQQLTDELARKCAESIHAQMHRLQSGAGGKHGVNIGDFQRTIICDLPLPELLEVARLAKMINTEVENPDLDYALTNLQKKVEL